MNDDASALAPEVPLEATEEQVEQASDESTEQTAPVTEVKPAAADDTAMGVAMPKSDILADEEDDEPYAPVDIFAWANNLYQYKDHLELELFLINKNNVMYSMKVADELKKQFKPLFIQNILDYVLNGAGEGLVVRGFEDAEAEDNVLQRTRWKNVDKLVEVMHWIRTQEAEIQQFVEEEHDLKRIKAVMLRGTHPSMPHPFYVIKALPRAQMMKGEGSWMVSGKLFKPFVDATALKVPADNQLLVIDQDLFVFSQPKLKSLFGYDAKKNSIAEKKVEEILSKYNLAFAEGEDMQTMVKGNKSLINKLQKLELRDDLSQEDILDHGDSLGVDLMCDDTGAIIIETPKDLSKFVGLLNDDFVESGLTGVRYEIQSKRELKPPKDGAEE